jgi:hypothetical protein
MPENCVQNGCRVEKAQLPTRQKIEKMSSSMKKVFMVTYSDDEPPEFHVADDAADALAEVLSRANELEIPVTGQTAVNLDGEYPDFDDFAQRYTLVKNPFDPFSALGGCTFAWIGKEWETVRNAPPEKLWTLIDSEGLWWISPGLHYVDRLGYLVTNEERGADERSYLYE